MLVDIPGLWFKVWIGNPPTWDEREYRCGGCGLRFFAPWGGSVGRPPDCPSCESEDVWAADDTYAKPGTWEDARWGRENSRAACQAILERIKAP
jgi:hypothetical protein